MLLGLLLSALTPLVGGCWLVGRAVRTRGTRGSGAGGEGWRLLMALSVLMWAVGQLVTYAQARTSPLGLPTYGELVQLSAVSLALAGVVRSPRPSRAGLAGSRVMLDAGLIAFCAGLGLWSQVIGPAVGYRVSVTSIFVLVSICGDLVMFATAAMVALREARRQSLLVLASSTCNVVAHTWFTLTALVGPRVLDPVPAVVWAFGWLLAIASIHTFPSGFGDAGQPMDTSGSGHATFWTRWFSAGSQRVIDPDWADRREARVSTGATGLALALVIASMAAGQKPPSVSADGGVGLGLVAVICLLGGTREVISARLRMKLVASLSTQAYEDPLTGLPNRRALTRRICATPPEQAWTVVTVDIDGFKQVNDALGHAGGDQILIQVAQVLCRIAQAPGMPARTGADEFALLCQGDVVAGEALAHRLLGEVSDVLAQSGGGLTLSVSAGVGRLVPHSQAQQRDDDRLSALVESAAALRSAKSQGRGQVGVFTEALAAARDRHALVERRLTQAVSQAQISVVAQPLVHLDSGALHGVEALARWTDADLGVVGPDEFIPVAESAGLILALGRQVLCTAVARGRSDGLFDAGIQVGVNVSPLQLLTPDFVPLVRALLDEHAVPGPSLVLEVTEAILVAEDDDTMRSLAHLKDAGVHLAIDDFGSGYSALNYLRRLPVDVVKIDRTWTVASMHDERTRSIVESVNALAHKLGAHVVMEGIEDEATAAMCREVGADLGQGWHFGRPQSYQDIMASLRAGRPGGQAIPAPR